MFRYTLKMPLSLQLMFLPADALCETNFSRLMRSVLRPLLKFSTRDAVYDSAFVALIGSLTYSPVSLRWVFMSVSPSSSSSSAVRSYSSVRT